ncbi:MAG: glycoside hydrolase family 2 TIM barrel-domain containing protein [Alistipes sp.]
MDNHNFRKLIVTTLLLISATAAAATETSSLNGKWKLDYWPQGDTPVLSPAEAQGVPMKSIEATVPGNVELDLLAAGLINAPEIGSNVYQLRSLEGNQWRYSRQFTTPKHEAEDHIWLKFGGIDCYAEIYVNGQHVGSADNMLIEHRFDITSALAPSGENEVEVYIKSSVIEGRQYTPPTISINFAQVESVYTRRAPHTYGWDIMPRLVSAGLWRDVELEVLRPAHIRDAHWFTARVDVANRQASVFLDYTIALPIALQEGKLTVEFSLSRNGKQVALGRTLVSAHAARHILNLDNVDFWWPRGYGEAALYDAEVKLLDQQGQMVDVDRRRIGIRTLKLDFTPIHTPQKPGRFCFVVNGERVFARGSNWTPMDALHSRDKQLLDRTFALVTDLNCNMLRCWGGNVYEDTRFYELCDENGVMVWQDFSMGCTFYSQRQEFARAIEREISAVVLKLRSHPSIALWSGNNENDQTLTIGTLAPFQIDPNRDVISRQVIPMVLYELDPTRSYLPSSPYWSEEVCQNGYSSALIPEDHLWGPRGYYKDPYYTQANCLFVSEIGYHGMPNLESLQQMFPPETVYPWSDAKSFRWNEDYLTKAVRIYKEWGYTPERNNLMINQVRILFGEVPTKLEDFIFASQSVQAEAMKFFVELYRGNKFAPKTGILWWNIRDGWPVISDAIVDYYFSKKMAYHFLKNVQRNVCVVVNDPSDGGYPLVATNDTRTASEGKVTVSDVATGKKIYEGDYRVEANARAEVARLPLIEGQGLLLIRYTTPEGAFANHYLYGKAPFKLNEYRKLLRKTNIYEIQ